MRQQNQDFFNVFGEIFTKFFKTRVICVVKTYKVLFLCDIKFKLENVTKFEKSR